MPGEAESGGPPETAPHSRRTLTIASLFAAIASAFTGLFLFLTVGILWDAFAHSNAPGLEYAIVPVGTFFISLFWFWVFLPLTLPPALIIAHLTPPLERLLSRSELCSVQYGAGAGAGFSLMLGLGCLIDRELAAQASVAGMFAGLVAIRTFRRFVYA